MASQISPTILPYLSGLEDAVGELANTWRPDDPAYRADVYRQIMMNLSYAYFVYFHADAEHPDWAPLWNPVYLLSPTRTTSTFTARSGATSLIGSAAIAAPASFSRSPPAFRPPD